MKRRYMPLLIGVVILVYYFRAFYLFFESDEWFYFSVFLPLTENFEGFISALDLGFYGSSYISGHLTPLYTLLWYIHNFLFGTQFLPYITLSILFHILNSILVFYFVGLLSKSSKVAIISAIFFALSSVHYQAVTWVITYMNTQLSAFFILFALIFLYMYSQPRGQRKYLLLFSVAFMLGLLIKESSVVLALLVPFFVFLFSRNNSRRYVLAVTGFLITIYGVFRFIAPAFLSRESGESVFHFIFAQPILNLVRLFVYPLRMLVEVFVPQEVILALSKFLTVNLYPEFSEQSEINSLQFLQFVEGPGVDLVVFPISIIILSGVLWSFIKSKRSGVVGKLSIFGFLIVTAGALPLVLISHYAPEWGSTTLIDSRHIYLSSVGGGIMFALLLLYLEEKVFILLSRFIVVRENVIAVSLLVVWSLMHLFLLQGILTEKIRTAQDRKYIVGELENNFKNYNNETVILLESTKGYYGFESIPPFQTSLGQIMVVKLYDNGLIGPKLVESGIQQFARLDSEGVIADGESKVGFFIQQKTLLKELYANKIELDNFVSYSWDGERLLNNTKERKESLGFLLRTYLKSRGWRSHLGGSGLYSFSYPGQLETNYVSNSKNIIESVAVKTKNGSVTIELHSKPNNIVFHEYVGSIEGLSDEESSGFTIKNVMNLSGGWFTTMYYKGEHIIYLVPFYDGRHFIKATYISGTNLVDVEDIAMYNQEVEQIIATLEI